MRKDGIKTVLTILENCIKDDASLSVEQLTAKTGLSKTNVREVVRILEKRGYIKKDKNGRHRLRPKFLQ